MKETKTNNIKHYKRVNIKYNNNAKSYQQLYAEDKNYKKNHDGHDNYYCIKENIIPLEGIFVRQGHHYFFIQVKDKVVPCINYHYPIIIY